MAKVKLLEIPVGKGCVLFLTREEFNRALKRGKAIRRDRLFISRQQKEIKK